MPRAGCRGDGRGGVGRGYRPRCRGLRLPRVEGRIQGERHDLVQEDEGENNDDEASLEVSRT